MAEYLKKGQPSTGDRHECGPRDGGGDHRRRARPRPRCRACLLAAVRQLGSTHVQGRRRRGQRARAAIAPEVLESLDFAHIQIRDFAELPARQHDRLRGRDAARRVPGPEADPRASAGAYVPGGKYPMLMSAQMSVLTAKVAGVERVVACAPPYEGRGMFPEMLWSMALAGADEIWCVGGVQALALMAYGAEGYEPVDFIAGPGNMYVAEAKRQLFGRSASTCWPGRPRSCDRRRRLLTRCDRGRRSPWPGRARPDLTGRPGQLVSSRRKRSSRRSNASSPSWHARGG